MNTSVNQQVALKKKKSLLGRIGSQWELLLFILPAMICLVIFAYVPMYGIILAFKEYRIVDGIIGSPWVGLDNFVRFFTLESSWKYIGNTIEISLLSHLLTFPLPIIFALLLHQVDCIWYKKIVQNFTYLPHMLSIVIVMNMTRVFTNPENGLINIIISWFGGEKINFFADPDYVFWIYWITGIWQGLGYSAVLYISALSGIDMEQLEAAKIDGANRFRLIWNIELPAIAETVIIMLIMNFGSMMSVGLDKMLLIKTSANIEASEVLSTYTYQVGLLDGDYGFSTAIGIFNTVVNLMCVLTVNWISGKVSDTSLF